MLTFKININWSFAVLFSKLKFIFQIVYSDDTIVTRPFDPIQNYRLPQHRESFIEIIENIAKQTIQLAKDAIKLIQSRIEQVIQDIYEKLVGVQQIANDTLNSILKDVENLSGNNQKDMNPCVQTHIDEVKQVIANGREEISKCIVTAMGEADDISLRLMPYVESIATLIKNITGVVEKCSTASNPISAAICITQHVREIFQFWFLGSCKLFFYRWQMFRMQCLQSFMTARRL